MAIELDNSFTVPVPPEQAWDVLLDVETIAPCMPGASVTSVDGDEIQGQVKVKLGPLSLSYKGTAKFTEKDQATHTISIEATGKETRGAGTVAATVQASLKPGDGADETLVSIHTLLNVTGRPAQFGRSLLPEVSGKLIAQFATNLQAMINADGATAETAVPETAVAETAAPETEPAAESSFEIVYFDFDKSDLRQDSRDALSKNAALILKSFPDAKIQIAGNCDERGSAEYNLALGERRAKSAEKYLITLGVKTENLSIISYGKEKPAVIGNDEAAWAKNRRDEFVVLK